MQLEISQNDQASLKQQYKVRFRNFDIIMTHLYEAPPIAARAGVVLRIAQLSIIMTQLCAAPHVSCGKRISTILIAYCRYAAGCTHPNGVCPLPDFRSGGSRPAGSGRRSARTRCGSATATSTGRWRCSPPGYANVTPTSPSILTDLIPLSTLCSHPDIYNVM